MYSLRIIEETRASENKPFEQVIENYLLGNSYAHLKKGVTKEFDKTMKNEFSEYDIKSVKSLICGENGVKMFIMENEKNKQYSYFIMTENGNTFERL